MTDDMLDGLEDNPYRPLADRLRPNSLAEYYGQTHILGEGRPLRQALEQGCLHSMIFWGPPGTGKTTLARLITHTSDALFLSISAVLSGVKEIREAVEQAKLHKQQTQQAVVLFVDEVHRFNKSQQDAFLPYIEDGTFYFIGATTENPSFELNKALLSRVRTYILKSLDEDALRLVIDRALASAHGLLDRQLTIEKDAIERLCTAADGDARRCLNWLEIAADLASDGIITCNILNEVTADTLRRFDNKGDVFYEQISALHKSVRGSSPDGALYWLIRMLDGGCDPVYLARRLVRMASEDIGNADPRALTLALNAWDTFDRLGSPEGDLTLAQCAVYLACAPKSNAVYTAYKQARTDVKQEGSHEVPMHLRNAPTKLMKASDFGKGYRYSHDEPEAFSAGQTYFPDGMGEREYYHPVERGLEIKIAQKIKHLRNLNHKIG